MNGYQNENMNNIGSCKESNSLVEISDMATKINAYVTSVKQITNNLDIFDNAEIAKIHELQELVKYQGERLLRCIKQHGVVDSELIKKAEDITVMLISLHVRLIKLKKMCDANKAAPIDEVVDKVAKSIRLQISCAMDFVYS